MKTRSEQMYVDGTNVVKTQLKQYIFDVIAAVIALVIIAATLHIFDIYDLSEPDEVKSFIVDWVPYFIATVLLNADFYEKGVFIAKGLEDYIKVKKAYSEKVSSIDGHKLQKVNEFCIEYNEQSLIDLRKSILKEEGLTYEQFNDKYIVEIDGEKKEFPALRTWKKAELKEKLTEEQYKVVKRAKKAKIKGINTNLLLGNEDVEDPTNIGDTEKELTIKHNIFIIVRYLFVTAFVSLVFIKDLKDWQWGGLVEVLFKLAFCFARSLMSYLKGYKNTSVNHANHLIRKTDILKIFDVWYDDKYVKKAELQKLV